MSEKKSRNKRFIKIFLGLLVVGVGSYIGFNKFISSNLEPVDLSDSKNITIIIPEGSSSSRIASILLENEVIKNEMVFKYKLKKDNKGSQLKAGEYNLSKSMAVDEIVEKLVEGGKSSKETVRFTIPEGYELREIADRLSQEGLVNRDRFIELTNRKENFQDDYPFLRDLEDGQSLEGFLFPSTYDVYVEAVEEDIINKMLKAFDDVYKEVIEPKLDMSKLSLNEIVTLGSIIEREARVESERPIISGVFYNRIERDMKLQSCATVQYILGERKPRLSNKDTATPSPYNTYVNPGLPPGPISSVGRASLDAAVNPEMTDYLYFVQTEDDGGHTFTRTYEEHREAAKGMK